LDAWSQINNDGRGRNYTKGTSGEDMLGWMEKIWSVPGGCTILGEMEKEN